MNRGQAMSEKIFKDTRTQIGILKSRGVVIKNKKTAKQIIRTINYYNLINGYKEPFLQTTMPYEKYLPGTTLDEIYALYEFDRKLRLITLEHILQVEKQAKSLIAHCFSKEHGHKDYLKLENFDNSGSKKYAFVCELLGSLYKKIALNIDKDLSISHYVNGKNYIPLWDGELEKINWQVVCSFFQQSEIDVHTMNDYIHIYLTLIYVVTSTLITFA